MDNLKNLKAEHCDRLNKEKAKRMLGNQGSASDAMPDKKIRPFKKGGLVKKKCN